MGGILGAVRKVDTEAEPLAYLLSGGADAEDAEPEPDAGADPFEQALSGCPGVKRIKSTNRVWVYGGGRRM